MTFVESTDVRLISGGILAGMLVLSGVAFYVSRRVQRGGSAADPEFGIVEGAILGLVGLILGFTFSVALSRFELRRDLLVNEANAIGTTYLRADFLGPADARAFRVALKSYTEDRLDAYAPQPRSLEQRAQANDRSVARQQEMWRIGVRGFQATRQPQSMGLLIGALNEMIDAGAAERAALLNRVPRPLVLLIAVIAITSAILIGFSFGRSKSPSGLVGVLFAVLLALVVATILDFDRPLSGLVQLDLSPLQDALAAMKG